MLKFLDDYEEGVIFDKVLYEIDIGLDYFKSQSFRQSTGLLDMLGDVGGFFGAFDVMISILAVFFSAKFF